MNPLFSDPPGDLVHIIHNLLAHRKNVREIIDRLIDQKEDRAIVLVGHLFIENALDEYLASSIPEYVNEIRIRSFYLKNKLAKSLLLSRPQIFDSAETINKIRNKFAHDIDFQTLEDLDEQYFNRLRDHLEFFLKDQEKYSEFTNFEIFRTVITNVVLSLDIDTWYCNHLNDYIRRDEFKEEFFAYTQPVAAKELAKMDISVE